ncbi:MAG: anhydro-N-acetylmuramic acid kinase [Alysiella sp.]|uniref:anhydro-N-acetylmuramic acid kinase n=1 Tax=Alysiella sp. TaxID=1872483 RepID=UPI0026DC30C7|nr:anhydro-N-acetylmuramic acid kinase [Alysiella sp.]MDO4434491.1 anhydro-N-acetylmuramic acid kinase [Alysiella sp.]
MKHTQLYIGIMSGTSMDGADAVLISMNGSQWQGALAHAFLPYSGCLKTALLDLQNTGNNELHRSQILAQELSLLYAQTVHQLLTQQNLSANNITAIGCHGQTIRHAPEHRYSIQLVNLPLLAEKTGILTIGDFRNRDLAAGGQGAPLVPAFHQALFAKENTSRVVLNIGGIANISVLHANTPPIGFDTGAGNMLLDAWAQHIWQHDYDTNGEIAAQGLVLPELLNKLLAHPYFKQPYPKSTGRELFSLTWLQSHLHGKENPYDVMRTLVQFTANSIHAAIIQAAPYVQQIYVCGGGIRNPVLMSCLKTLFTEQAEIHSTATLSLDPQWVEAAAFAWLAACWVNRTPSNPHIATGANKALILGSGHYA